MAGSVKMLYRHCATCGICDRSVETYYSDGEPLLRMDTVLNCKLIHACAYLDVIESADEVSSYVGRVPSMTVMGMPPRIERWESD